MTSKYAIDDIKVHKYILEPIRSNMYVMIKNQTACIIDPHISVDADKLLEKNIVKQITIVLTHEHYDHISGVNHFRENWDCVVIGNAITKEYLPSPQKTLSAFYKSMLFGKEESIIRAAENVFDENYSCYADIGFEKEYFFQWNGCKIHLIETPGHSKGSICVVVNDRYLFSGDSLVADNLVITKLPGGSKKEYMEITGPFLKGLPKDIIVFPGHGDEGQIDSFEIV